jgi:hypothetical protein
VVEAFRRIGLNFEPRVLPCGHYTTGETPTSSSTAGTWAGLSTAPSKRCAKRKRSRPRAKVHPLVNAGQLAVEHAARAEAVGGRSSPERESCPPTTAH